MTFDDLLQKAPRPVLLDGATGTELERRGFALKAAGWSARAIEEAPELLEQIHADYVAAGAKIITANTFRLHARNLADWGREDDQMRLVIRAVELARKGAGHSACVAGSLAPIGDCYSPEEVPELETLRAQHEALARQLAEAGVDCILIETMVAAREAIAAAQAARSTGLPFLVSFVTGPGGRLLSGELLADALEQLHDLHPAAVGINCVSCSHVDESIRALVAGCGGAATLVAANTGERAADGSWSVTTASQPAVYAGLAQGWRDRGIAIIGGCCGTTPAHVSAMQQTLMK